MAFTHAHSSDSDSNRPPPFFTNEPPPAFSSQSDRSPARPSSPPGAAGTGDLAFDIFEWSPKYASCQRYFLDHGQHTGAVQALAAFLNILLPYQRNPPVSSAASALRFSPGNAPPGLAGTGAAQASASPNSPFAAAPGVSLYPYLRRLVVTGLDYSGVLHGFFGDDWQAGIGPLHEQERRNLLFAAKSGGWADVKRQYDMGPLETVPFLRPLQGVVEAELAAAEKSWSEWLALEDWMVGPRAPDEQPQHNR